MRGVLRGAAFAGVLGLLSSMAVAAESAGDHGYRLLLTRPYSAPTMTEAMLWDLWKVWPEPARGTAAKASPAERRAMVVSYYGLVQEAGRELPIGFVSTPGGGLTSNCLSCHSGTVAGQAVRGLGNSRYTSDALPRDLAALMRAEGLAPPPGAGTWPVGLPAVVELPVVGTSNAFGASAILLAVRDKDMNVLSTPAYAPPVDMVIPLKTPAWWTMKRKAQIYWDGFAQRSVREGMMQFTMAPENSAAMIKGFEPDFNAVYAWIMSLKAPKYPWPIDRPLASRGRLIFANSCAQCHGTYGAGASFPERTVDLAAIGTDPLRITHFSPTFRKALSSSWLGDYGRLKTVLAPTGYVAPPLDGVWATAPYLHNGSVPTLADLLRPDERPAIWRRSDTGYNTERVGIEVEVLKTAPPADAVGVRRDSYRTDLPGLSNAGHRYPARPLSDRDQKALLEYLKTL